MTNKNQSKKITDKSLAIGLSVAGALSTLWLIYSMYTLFVPGN